MATALVTITRKKKYSMGTPDAGGNKRICVTGIITMSSETQTTTSNGVGFDLSADIPNIDTVFIQGDAGYIVQYDYSNKEIEVRGFTVADTEATTAKAFSETTASSLNGQVFYFRAEGF